MTVRSFHSPDQGKLWVGPWRSVDNAGRLQVLMGHLTPGLNRFNEASIRQEDLRLNSLLRSNHEINLVGVEDSMHGLVTIGALLTQHSRKRFGRDTLTIKDCGMAAGSEVSKATSLYRHALGALVYSAVQGIGPEASIQQAPNPECGDALGDLGIAQVTTVGGLQKALTDEFEWLRDGRVLAGPDELLNPQSLPEDCLN